VLWQSGGIVALFAVRIALALAGELVALHVLGEWGQLRARAARAMRGPLGAVIVALLPAIHGLMIAASILVATIAWSGEADANVPIALAALALAAGCLAGMIAGCVVALRRERTREAEEYAHLADARHDLRAPLTVLRGEVEVVLARRRLPADRRAESVESALRALDVLAVTIDERIRPRGERSGSPEDGLPRERHPERGALAGPVVHTGRATVRLGDGTDDGEAEPGARMPA
jgi:signal transduction histidine kinase